ncbi:transcription initiation factor IIF subunit alpha [Monosporozyma servazzii]
MSMSRRSGPGNGRGGGSVSPFIKKDRFRRTRKARSGLPIAVKKEDPDAIEANEKRLLGVEIAAAAVKKEQDEDFNEFPLRATSKEKLENMRTHLLKFQSKKKIGFKESFHPPIRLHRKDTRNLQFQLTRAEIVQRQREIADYKKKQDEEGGTASNNNTQKPHSAHTSTSTPVPTAVLHGTPIIANGTPVASTTNIPDVKDSNGPVLNNTDSKQESESTQPTDKISQVVPMITQLEEAGISENPEKVGMVKYDGKEELDAGFEEGTTDPFADVAPDGGGRARRVNSKRKTRQLKVLDENAKKLRFEEFYPWVMEDYDGYNTWVGSYEAGNSDSYVMLCVEDDGSFTMIPADKVYKFTARNKYATLTIEEAEKRMDKKSGEVPRWLMKHLDNIGTTTTRYDRTKRRLKAVADQRSVGGDDDEEHDDNSEVELDYDEEFADDEEAPIIDGNEQENKESEQRIKKEMLQANAMGLRDDEIIPTGEDDDLFNEKKIDEEGERIKKALQKTELAALYSSDDEINPYLSESDLENTEVKKEGEDADNSKENTESPSKKARLPQVKKEKSPSRLEPQLKVKSIKNCVIILKGDKKFLRNFPEGEWNPTAIKRERGDTMESPVGSPSPSVKLEEPDSKKVKLETTDTIPLITEQDIKDAIGDGKVNVKDFGKAIRKRFPGTENKKLMFAIVKKLCRKVGTEHMELKK